MSVVKVSWSGGKDSTCALKLHLDRGDYVKALCYIPMLNDKIPLLLKEQYDFILNTADKFRSLGAEVYIVHGLSYYDFVHKKIIRGINKGKYFGFPPFVKGMCTFKNYSKLPALNKFDVGYFDYEDIGIASDEQERLTQLNSKKRSILLEYNFTENDALKYCHLNNILSPIYNEFSRDGCTICPHAPALTRVRWYAQYPEAFKIILELQDFVKRERPEQTPLRNFGWFIDDRNVQLDLLDTNKKYNLF